MPKSIPFRVVELEPNSYHILVKGTIGRRAINLIVDSGASRTVIDKQLAGTLRTQPLKIENPIAAGFMADQVPVDLVRVSSIRLANHPFRNIEVIVADLSGINELYSRMAGISIHGLIGCDFLLKHISSIGFKHHKLFLAG